MKSGHQVYVTRWDDVFRPGRKPTVLAPRFEKAGRATTALLVYEGEPVAMGLFESNPSGHAEENLLRSSAWHSTVMKVQRERREVEVVVLINRTPCHASGCSRKLAEALRGGLQPSSRRNARFVLACTGIYETAGPLQNRQDQGPTTNFDLRALISAGWQLRALQVGAVMTDRGRILAQYIPRAEAAVRA